MLLLAEWHKALAFIVIKIQKHSDIKSYYWENRKRIWSKLQVYYFFFNGWKKDKKPRVKFPLVYNAYFFVYIWIYFTNSVNYYSSYLEVNRKERN